MYALQCSECELKFRSPADLGQHMALDHPGRKPRARSGDESTLGAARRRRHIRESAPKKER